MDTKKITKEIYEYAKDGRVSADDKLVLASNLCDLIMHLTDGADYLDEIMASRQTSLKRYIVASREDEARR